MTTILLIGCGNMGRALLDGWLAAGVAAPGQVTVADPLAEVPVGVARVDEAPSEPFDLTVLAIKPQQLDTLGPRLSAVSDGGLLLSILAGVSVEHLSALAPGARVARIMANLAAGFGMSPVALFAGPTLTEADRALLDALGSANGRVEWLADEDLLHAVTALGGSGPGFVYRLLAAFAAGGAELGLSPQAAAGMALTMVRGAAELAERSGEDFATLAARVASPGGTTLAGLAALEEGGVDALVADTLRAARNRSVELSGGNPNAA